MLAAAYRRISNPELSGQSLIDLCVQLCDQTDNFDQWSRSPADVLQSPSFVLFETNYLEKGTTLVVFGLNLLFSVIGQTHEASL